MKTYNTGIGAHSSAEQKKSYGYNQQLALNRRMRQRSIESKIYLNKQKTHNSQFTTHNSQ